MAIASIAQLNQITNLYVSLFNRTPDTAGLSFWSSALVNGASIATITRGFLTAPEGQANYPQFQSASEFVNAFYTKVFSRTPDAGGLAFWTAALNGAGGANSDAAKATVVAQIVAIVSTPLTARPDGLTDAQYAQTMNDRAFFANKVEIGTYLASHPNGLTTNVIFPSITADPLSVAVVKNTADVFGAPIAASLATTAGTAVLGSDAADVFSLTSAQLVNADSKAGFSLDGGAGVDMLLLTTTGSTTISDTIKNFTNIEVIGVSTSVGNTTTVAAGKFLGATGFLAVGAGSTIVNGLAAGQGLTLLLSAGTSTAANYLATATAASVSFSSGASGSVGVSGTGLTSATINSTGPTANVSGNVNLAGTIGAVTVNASTALTTSLIGAKQGAVLTVTGGGALTLSALSTSFTTVNAGAATGGLTTAIGTSVTSLTGSSANDKITVAGSLAAGATISLGAGSDALLFATNGAIAAGSTIDAGAGVDTLSSKLVTAANASVFKNFELLQIEAGSITDASLLTGSTLTGLTLAGGNGAGAVNNVAATLGLTVTGAATGTTTIGVSNAATNAADVYTITLANAAANTAAAAGTIGLANVETINIVSGGTNLGVGLRNSIDISDAALKTLVITGSQAAQVTFSTATTATSSIDGSAATGSLNIDTTNLVAATAANGGLTVKGGTAADSLTISQNAVVTGGAGNDLFVIKSTLATLGASDATAATEIAAKLVTITDFAKGDVIDFLPAVANLGTSTTAIVFADLSGSASLAAAAQIAVGAGGQSIEAFRFGGDTYLVADLTTAATFGAGDMLVKLSGVVDLTNAKVDYTTGEIFIA